MRKYLDTSGAEVRVGDFVKFLPLEEWPECIGLVLEVDPVLIINVPLKNGNSRTFSGAVPESVLQIHSKVGE